MFNQIDQNFMRLALNEAENCYARGDIPVGAVLTIDNNLEGIAGNSSNNNGDWISHAENSLLQKVSWKIKQKPKGIVRLYTTWEPCMMCAGAAVLSRVNEFVYACPDPNGGFSKVDPKDLGPWYEKHWPTFREGPFKRESYELLKKHMEENIGRWGNFLENFKIDL
ncbi:nucleoside deaminase [archaeon]|jgi:tRNA(adenine34) deaminase|nr:nucleoside deaminase [archaeon]MBT4374028.1 nucleoside deaminase [archaeon]MBT4532124.1 nucleoside deaminase [archaeon]MBT7002014.1 nucleoside deaminase [archaeon]MBT7282725.1 nucleoside deaminase [archaeon]